MDVRGLILQSDVEGRSEGEIRSISTRIESGGRRINDLQSA
jgi:hypothetical protein